MKRSSHKKSVKLKQEKYESSWFCLFKVYIIAEKLQQVSCNAMRLKTKYIYTIHRLKFGDVRLIIMNAMHFNITPACSSINNLIPFHRCYRI